MIPDKDLILRFGTVAGGIGRRHMHNIGHRKSRIKVRIEYQFALIRKDVPKHVLLFICRTGVQNDLFGKDRDLRRRRVDDAVVKVVLPGEKPSLHRVTHLKLSDLSGREGIRIGSDCSVCFFDECFSGIQSAFFQCEDFFRVHEFNLRKKKIIPYQCQPDQKDQIERQCQKDPFPFIRHDCFLSADYPLRYYHMTKNNGRKAAG